MREEVDLDAAGLRCERVSVGSTPTAHFAETLDGVTEMRAGVFVFSGRTAASCLGACGPLPGEWASDRAGRAKWNAPRPRPRYTRWSFQPPRRKSTMLTSASVAYAMAIARYTPCGPSPVRSARNHAGGTSQHAFVIPASALVGATLLVSGDLLARTVASVVLPVGPFMVVLGVPLFLWLLWKQV